MRGTRTRHCNHSPAKEWVTSTPSRLHKNEVCVFGHVQAVAQRKVAEAGGGGRARAVREQPGAAGRGPGQPGAVAPPTACIHL